MGPAEIFKGNEKYLLPKEIKKHVQILESNAITLRSNHLLKF